MALKPALTREYLDSKIGDVNVFNFYFGDFQLDKSYNSVFRKDDKPSTGFYISKNGSIIYNDLTTGDKYDFIHFVMKLYDLNYYKAMQQIAIDFGLIEGERSTSKPAVIKAHRKTVAKKKDYVITTGKFKPYHLDYWKQYHITEDELKANNIKPVTGVTIDGYDLPLDPNELRFMYLFTEDDKKYFKVYSPYSVDYKWFGNVPLHVPYGLDTLEFKSDTLVITKSVKDYLVLKKFFSDVIALQNESKSSIRKQIMEYLRTKYKFILVWFDADKAGKVAAEWYKTHYPGTEAVTTPDQCYTKHAIKDPSDFVKHYGLDIFEQYLKTFNDRP